MPAITVTCPHCGKQGDSVHVKYCPKSHSPRAFKPMIEMRDESLDCYWCGKLFDDFKGLALHVQNHGVENFEEAVRYYTAQAERIPANMALPTPEVASGNNNPFLKAEHFGSKERGTLKVSGGRLPTGDSKKYNDILLDVKLNGTPYTWGLKADQRNYAALFKRFGSDEKKWKGSVNVVIAKGKYINVEGA
jgi:hypothetical protein